MAYVNHIAGIGTPATTAAEAHAATAAALLAMLRPIFTGTFVCCQIDDFHEHPVRSNTRTY